jgi:hypothetical protein
MKDESDLDSVSSAESSNGFRNSDEDTPSLGAYNRDYDDDDNDDEDDVDHSGDENDEDQDISSQEGDNVSRNDDEGEDEDQEHSDKNDSDDDDDDGDDDDDDESMDEGIAMRTSRGKSLELSYADSNTDESDNDDGRDDDEDDNNSESMFDSPSKDNGQEDEDMDTEDADQNEETPLEDDHSPIDDSVVETSAVIATPLNDESTEHTPGTGVSDVVAVAVESASEPSEQVEVVVAAVVPKKAKRKTPASNKKKAVSPKKSKTSKKKGTGGRRKRSDSDLSTSSNAISRDRLEAAQQARNFLIKSVNQTPFALSESHVVQNFGRIKVEDSENPLFSNPTSLYPVGFACDRYEFSPVHGRLLKMRCEILDGSKFKEGLNTEPGNEENKVKPKRHDGPLFRISWGQGIDELDEGSPFPFEVYSSCTPMTNEVDTVAVPLGFHSSSTKPEKGMRVKVRVDKYSWYRGTIISAKNTEDEKDDDDSSKRKSSKKKKQTYHIKIAYDDGLTEDAIFPDPDISLVAPG